jgi:uncharacterized membrane protein
MTNMNASTITLIIAAVLTGLIAGLFYSYSCSVNPGLGGLSDTSYLAAMQSINRAILNPVFFASFMGTLIFLPVSAYLNRNTPGSSTFILLAAAAAVYIIGTFGVTMFGNVTLNNALDAINLNAPAEELSKQRALFEKPWNSLHQVRTLASVLAFVLVILACVTRSNQASL